MTAARFDVLDLTNAQAREVSAILGGDGDPVRMQDWGSADRRAFVAAILTVRGTHTAEQIDAMTLRDMMELVAVDEDPTPPTNGGP